MFGCLGEKARGISWVIFVHFQKFLKCWGMSQGNFRIPMQDYKFLCVAVMISDTLVNTHTHTHTHRQIAFDWLY